MYFYAKRGAASWPRFFSLSKTERHNTIRELVATAMVSNQDELRRKLVKRGFDVTQATVSRDIHELHLVLKPRNDQFLQSRRARIGVCDILKI